MGSMDKTFLNHATCLQEKLSKAPEIAKLQGLSKQLNQAMLSCLCIARKPKPAFLPHYPAALICHEVKRFQAIITICETSSCTN